MIVKGCPSRPDEEHVHLYGHDRNGVDGTCEFDLQIEDDDFEL